jgi:omega-3 fatty acid desaturase (delta-15 desaturase)
MHHITDGHVAHHLFFIQLPHYHLKEETTAIAKFLQPYGVYKKRTSYDFLLEFCSLNLRLEYLFGEGSGVLTYPSEKEKTRKGIDVTTVMFTLSDVFFTSTVILRIK